MRLRRNPSSSDLLETLRLLKEKNILISYHGTTQEQADQILVEGFKKPDLFKILLEGYELTGLTRDYRRTLPPWALDYILSDINTRGGLGATPGEISISSAPHGVASNWAGWGGEILHELVRNIEVIKAFMASSYPKTEAGFDAWGETINTADFYRQLGEPAVLRLHIQLTPERARGVIRDIEDLLQDFPGPDGLKEAWKIWNWSYRDDRVEDLRTILRIEMAEPPEPLPTRNPVQYRRNSDDELRRAERQFETDPTDPAHLEKLKNLKRRAGLYVDALNLDLTDATSWIDAYNWAESVDHALIIEVRDGGNAVVLRARVRRATVDGLETGRLVPPGPEMKITHPNIKAVEFETPYSYGPVAFEKLTLTVWDDETVKIFSRPKNQILSPEGTPIRNPDQRLRDLERQHQADPEDLEIQSRYRHALIRAGRADEAGLCIGDVVEVEEHTHSSTDPAIVGGPWIGIVTGIHSDNYSTDPRVYPRAEIKELWVKWIQHLESPTGTSEWNTKGWLKSSLDHFKKYGVPIWLRGGAEDGVDEVILLQAKT